jgi:AsmA-like C-terminal region
MLPKGVESESRCYMTTTPTKTQTIQRRMMKWGGGIVLLFCVGGLVISALVWPFRESAVIKVLEEQSFSQVAVGSFHQTYFPRPGCDLDQVVFRHHLSGAPPLITIQHVRIEGSFIGLFRRHVKLIRVEGMQVNIPALGSEQFETPQRSSVVIDNLVADGATLEIQRADGNPTMRFAFHGFTMTDIGGTGAASFDTTLTNAEPPGEVTTTGKFGPWNAHSVGETPISGDFYFKDAKLETFPGISGILSSSGRYRGTLEHLQVEGSTDIPAFAVDGSAHETDLRTQFRTEVNAVNGDVFLQNANVHFRNTNISSFGEVAGEQGRDGKIGSFEVAAKNGRIQDLLLLFTEAPHAPLTGAVSFRAKVTLPSGEASFLSKVQLQGDFGVEDANFTSSDTQSGVVDLSRGASGQKKRDSKEDVSDPQNVLSDLKGHVVVKDGIAKFSDLSFSVPGAVARLNGTYNLIGEKIDLRGTLTTKEEISKAAHGVKALLLKALDPFLKNKSQGYTTPVKISGTYSHPSFGLDLSDRNNAESQTARLRERLRAHDSH